jgi:methylenetetrahydrofolate dehydrogenase (NADP+) / methenyltetrahydrofolate cyclohydrolase
MTTLLKGKPVADAMAEAIREEVKQWQSKEIHPALTLIRAGEKPDDQAYERAIIKRCESVGVQVKSEVVAEDISQESFLNLLEQHNQDPAFTGFSFFGRCPNI